MRVSERWRDRSLCHSFGGRHARRNPTRRIALVNEHAKREQDEEEREDGKVRRFLSVPSHEDLATSVRCEIVAAVSASPFAPFAASPPLFPNENGVCEQNNNSQWGAAQLP